MSAATSRAATMVRPEAHGDPEARFRGLVQSPLRAGLLRFLSARPGESFEVESLMASTGKVLRIPEKQMDAVTAIIVGIVLGAVGTIFIATPLLVTLLEREPEYSRRRKEEESEAESLGKLLGLLEQHGYVEGGTRVAWTT